MLEIDLIKSKLQSVGLRVQFIQAWEEYHDVIVPYTEANKEMIVSLMEDATSLSLDIQGLGMSYNYPVKGSCSLHFIASLEG